jgi:hypothetical protein
MAAMLSRMLRTRTGPRSALAAACVVVAAAACASSSGAGSVPVTRLSYWGPVGLTGPMAATDLADLLRETAAAQHIATPQCSEGACWRDVRLSEPTLLVAVIPVDSGCFDERKPSARLTDARTLRITITVKPCKVEMDGSGTRARPAQELYGIPLSKLPHASHLDVVVEVAGIPETGTTPQEVGTTGIELP